MTIIAFARSSISCLSRSSAAYKMRTIFSLLLAYACTTQGQLTSCGSPEAGPVLVTSQDKPSLNALSHLNLACTRWPPQNGIDIVATFAQAKAAQGGTPTAPPVMGASDFNHTDSEGFVYHFSSADNAAAYAGASGPLSLLARSLLRNRILSQHRQLHTPSVRGVTAAFPSPAATLLAGTRRAKAVRALRARRRTS